MTVLNVLLLITRIVIACNVHKALKEINEVQIAEYTLTENAIEVNGESYTVVFGRNSVQIENSYKIKDRADRLAVLAVIRNQLQVQGLSSRSITSMEGEWVLHNKAYCLGERKSSPDVDLDYERDPRWYVALLSEMLGKTGL